MVDGKWRAGLVKKIDVVSSRQVYLTVNAEGDVPKEVKVVWPSANVGYCKDFIKNRECDPAFLNPNAAANSYRINFGRTKIEGFVLDSGNVFSEQEGLEFGWEEEATSNIRTRTANGNKLLDNIILFNPDKASKWCNGQEEATVNCEPNSWKVKVEPANYKVKITIGDSEIGARHDLTVNGKPVLGKFLKEGQFFTFEDDQIDALSGFITLSASCPETAGDQCKFSWSRVSSIEFVKQETKEEATDQKAPEKTAELGCGESVTGGRCSESENVENCIFKNF